MQAAKTSHVRSVAVPLIMYGTAWKEDRTQALVLEAIATGFGPAVRISLPPARSPVRT
jgi:hypothetical protein